MNPNIELILVLALLVALAFVLFGYLGRRKSLNASEQSTPVEDFDLLVIIGLDFSTSMRKMAAAFCRAWNQFRAEQQGLKRVGFRIYLITGTDVDAGSRTILTPSQLPIWSPAEFIQRTSPGTPLNRFFSRACSRAKQWRAGGYNGKLRILAFTDGAPDQTDQSRSRDALGGLASARNADGVEVNVYTLAHSSDDQWATWLADSLGLSCSKPGAELDGAELVVHHYDKDPAAIVEAMREASQCVRNDAITGGNTNQAGLAEPRPGE